MQVQDTDQQNSYTAQEQRESGVLDEFSQSLALDAGIDLMGAAMADAEMVPTVRSGSIIGRIAQSAIGLAA